MGVRTRYVVPLVLFAFVAGAALSYSQLQPQLNGARQTTELLVGKMRVLLASQEQYRAMSHLEASVDVVGWAMNLDEAGARRKHAGQEYRDMLKSRIATLESIRPQMTDAAAIEKSDSLLKQAQELLQRIEVSYP